MTITDRARPDKATTTAPTGRHHELPGRAWAGLLGRTAEFLGALDRGVGRRLLALAVSGMWDRPLAKLHDLEPPLLLTVAMVGWLAAVPLLFGFNAWTPTLLAPPVGFFAVLAASREYGRTTRGRARGMYGIDGWATYWDLQRAMTRYAVRNAAVQTRPSLEDATRGRLTDRPAARLIARLPVTECGTWVGDTAVGPWRSISLFAPHRDVVGMIAPPQTGKTATMGHAILDHPGAVVSTSTKPDLFEYTSELRKLVAASGDVELFNPENLGNHPSTFAWSPLAGCQVSHVAAERAGAMVGATSAAGGEDGTFWLDSAAKVLRCFLLAAALDDDRTMVDVAAWISSHELATDALDILEAPRYRMQVPQGWALELAQVISTSATKTRESIFLTLAQSVAFMADPDVAALCTPDPGAPMFDVEAFLADRGTLFLVGSEREHATIAPLLAALTTHVFEEAKRVAARHRKGRLDPPLLLALDEAALITPVALDRWTADAGGRGIHIIWTCQSPSQLAQRWGARGKDTIWNNSNAKLVFGGLTVIDDLEDISRLCGTVGDGDERRPLLTVDGLRELPQWHALLLHRNTRPTIVRVTPVWERRDVRHSPPPAPTSRIEDRVARRRIGDPSTQEAAA